MYDDLECLIVHTGQHYDYAMSQTFFDDLELPEPDHFLDAGSGSHAEQTAKVMVAFEKVCLCTGRLTILFRSPIPLKNI